MTTPDFYDVNIDYTAKQAGQEQRTGTHGENHKFKDMAEVKAFLKEKFGTSRRQPMYVDTKAGAAIQTGYVYHYKEKELADNGRKYLTFYIEAWVSVRGMTITNPFEKGQQKVS
jgi:hypothetical protein